MFRLVKALQEEELATGFDISAARRREKRTDEIRLMNWIPKSLPPCCVRRIRPRIGLLPSDQLDSATCGFKGDGSVKKLNCQYCTEVCKEPSKAADNGQFISSSNLDGKSRAKSMMTRTSTVIKKLCYPLPSIQFSTLLRVTLARGEDNISKAELITLSGNPTTPVQLCNFTTSHYLLFGFPISPALHRQWRKLHVLAEWLAPVSR